MGYMRDHAIVVTCFEEELLLTARRKAIALFGVGQVSAILKALVNDYTSFCVGPDGSKEGWAESDEGDAKRASFVEWLDQQRETDGSSALRWVVVQYGDDEGVSFVVTHSDEERRIAEGAARERRRNKQ